MTWERDDIIMMGRCPRLMYRLPWGRAYVEAHSAECQRECGTPKGWTLQCPGLLGRVSLVSTDEDEAVAETTELLIEAMQRLMGSLNGVLTDLRSEHADDDAQRRTDGSGKVLR